MLMCSELIYTDMDAYRSLWTFLATKHDLVGNITIAKVIRTKISGIWAALFR